jgi:hypothetical protein
MVTLGWIFHSDGETINAYSLLELEGKVRESDYLINLERDGITLLKSIIWEQKYKT